MSNIGLLPASGKSERLGGIPKFLFPVNNKQTLLEWHVEKMSEVCDEIRISTRSMWIPLIKNMSLASNVKIYEIEPSTMSDACRQMIDDDSRYLIGMPDTYVHNSDNFYKNLSKSTSIASLSVFNFYDSLIGKVGQVNIKNGHVVSLVDKDLDCKWQYMWGAISVKGVDINPKYSHPGIQIAELAKDTEVQAIVEPGKYIDLGTFQGIKEFYSTV
jgi:hypothetical protein